MKFIQINSPNIIRAKIQRFILYGMKYNGELRCDTKL